MLPLGLHPPLAALGNQLLCVGVPYILCILCAVAPVQMMCACLRCSAFALRKWLYAQVPAIGHAVYVESTEVARVWERAAGALPHGDGAAPEADVVAWCVLVIDFSSLALSTCRQVCV